MITLLAVCYLAAMGVLFVFGLNHLMLAGWCRRAGSWAEAPPSDAPDDDLSAWPAVTVQLPLYNERFVAQRLIDACAALDYPRDRLHLQVLDDSSDDTPALVAERVDAWRSRGLDVEHVRRIHRTGYKAGALAHGLTSARGELVAVFDADFVPPPDFLRRTVPLFRDPGLGMVQARWAHLNADASVLTRAQAALLDGHFVVEQGGRQAAGWFTQFNGTAGLWRRACIEDAGGWHADTLTEDLDLSYRAQLQGWRFRFLGGVAVPAELPASAAAWRRQQFRWTKGTAETARKLLGRLWHAPLPFGTRLQGSLHLGSVAAYPAGLAVVLLHAPVLTAHALGHDVSAALIAALSVGMVALAGVVSVQLLAQRTLYPDWARRLLGLPWWLAASAGLVGSNTLAVWEAVRRRPSAFERTPKGGYRSRTSVPRLEAALALYAVAGLIALAASGAWAAVPFQVLFVVGFASAAGYDAWSEWVSTPRARGSAPHRTLMDPRGQDGPPAAPACPPAPRGITDPEGTPASANGRHYHSGWRRYPARRPASG